TLFAIGGTKRRSGTEPTRTQADIRRTDVGFFIFGSDMNSYLEIWNVGKTYPTRTGKAVIVRDFNLKVDEGEFVCLIGHSGCGKSTVLSMVAGLNEKSTGGIILAGREIDGAGPDRGVVFQSPCLFPWMTALENVL